MTTPFYVSPEQVMKDRADYARKGISRGRSLVALEYKDGIVMVAENPSKTLNKISEIYDRIAFAGVGKYNEFQLLRNAGVRLADQKGYAYSRDDVDAKELANTYAQTLGQIFTNEMKPFEVEILIAQVGVGDEPNEMFHVLYDGTVMDEQGYCVLGGHAAEIEQKLSKSFKATFDLAAAIKAGVAGLKSESSETFNVENLEVGYLAKSSTRRCFKRMKKDELDKILS